MTTRKTRNAGFTLIEVLLAIMLTAMICAVLYGVVYSTAETHKRIAGYNEASIVGDRIVDMLAEDLKSCYVAEYAGEDVFVGEERGSEGFLLTFITCTSAKLPAMDNDKEGIFGFREVSYVTSRNDNGYLSLYRREAPLDDELTKGGRFALLHDQVESFEVRFLDAEAEEIDWDEAKSEWTYQPDAPLPKTVLVNIVVSVGERMDDEFEADERNVSGYRREEVYRIIAMTPGAGEDMSKLAKLEPKDPRARKAVGGAGQPGQPGQTPGQPGATPGQPGVNELLRQLQGGGRAPRANPGSNPLQQLLQRQRAGR